MSLQQRIQEDLKTAMKAKDQATLRTLRAIKSAFLLASTEKGAGEITEEKETQILQKLAKQRKDSLTMFEEQNREDLASKEREEIEVIERYLPEQLSEEEVKNAIQKIITDTGASGMKDMGKVMGMAGKQFAGKADNKVVANLVKQLLNA